nr:TPA_asm: NADH dehydrogenase subunit 4L [Tetraponera rufonigra]
MFYDYMFFLMFFISMVLLVYSYKYMLVVLIMVELVIFNVTLIMGLSMSMINLDFIIVYYLVFSLCESVLGMALLVLCVRAYGNDLYYFFNIKKFYDKIYYFYYDDNIYVNWLKFNNIL